MPDRLDVEAIETASRSDVGRRRSENQDSCGDFRHLAGTRLLILADGMGGHRGGGFASRTCVDAFARVFKEQVGTPEEQLRAGFDLANQDIYEHASGEESLRGMGTTGVAILIASDATAVLAWVGDSRAYRLRGGEIEQLTRDHALVAEWVRKGVVSAEEAKTHPRRSELTRAIGIAPAVDPEFVALELEPSDRFLLCSDGLSGLVRAEEIGMVLGGEDADRAVQTLVDRANALGGTDNVSVQVAILPPNFDAAEEDPLASLADEMAEEDAERAAQVRPSETAPPPATVSELPKLLYVSDPRRFHATSALFGAAIAALVLVLAQYVVGQLSNDLRRLEGVYEIGDERGAAAEPRKVVAEEPGEFGMSEADQSYAPAGAIELLAAATTEPTTIVHATESAFAGPGGPAAQPAPPEPVPVPSLPASGARLEPRVLPDAELPTAAAYDVEPALRRFLDAWLRAIATRDYARYRELGFREPVGNFATTLAGFESYRLESVRTEPLRRDPDQVFIKAVLSYVFEDAKGRWRTEDEHLLVLRRTAEGLRFEARWK